MKGSTLFFVLACGFMTTALIGCGSVGKPTPPPTPQPPTPSPTPQPPTPPPTFILKPRIWGAMLRSKGDVVYMLGGQEAGTYNAKNDVWKTVDLGRNWSLVESAAPWSGRYGFGSTVLGDGSLMIAGGTDNINYFDDVWIMNSTADGDSWTQVEPIKGKSRWSARAGNPLLFAMPDGRILLIGGLSNTSEALIDIWQSFDRGASWAERKPAPWSPRIGLSAVQLSTGEIIVTGGANSKKTTYFNDVWTSTDSGFSWYNNSKDIPPRGAHQTVVMDDDTVLLMGGESDQKAFDDVWISKDKGKTWKEQTKTAPWAGRKGFMTAVAQNQQLLLCFGYNEQTYKFLDDTWTSSDEGKTWQQVPQATLDLAQEVMV